MNPMSVVVQTQSAFSIALMKAIWMKMRESPGNRQMIDLAPCRSGAETGPSLATVFAGRAFVCSTGAGVAAKKDGEETPGSAPHSPLKAKASAHV
jgi:hypothetical protein